MLEQAHKSGVAAHWIEADLASWRAPAPYDVVYVPKTGIAEVFDFFQQYLLNFVPVSWGFSYVVGNGGGSTVIPTTTATTGH